MIGWKVLDKHRMSYLASAGRVSYRTGKIAVPKKDCGPLCVFSSKIYAETFARKCAWKGLHFLVVKCEYQPSRELHIWHSKLRELGIPYLPTGTVLADSVTCLE